MTSPVDAVSAAEDRGSRVRDGGLTPSTRQRNAITSRGPAPKTRLIQELPRKVFATFPVVCATNAQRGKAANI